MSTSHDSAGKQRTQLDFWLDTSPTKQVLTARKVLHNKNNNKSFLKSTITRFTMILTAEITPYAYNAARLLYCADKNVKFKTRF